MFLCCFLDSPSLVEVHQAVKSARRYLKAALSAELNVNSFRPRKQPLVTEHTSRAIMLVSDPQIDGHVGILHFFSAFSHMILYRPLLF